MPRPRSDIDRRIVRAAKKRFLADGVDGASIRAIARAARTSLGMVTYYFPSKDDLFFAVVEEAYGVVLRDLERILGGDAPLADRLRRVSIRIGSATDEEVDVVRLVVREALVGSARFRRLVERFQAGHIALAMAALRDGVARGDVDPRVPISVLLGCVLGTMGAPQIARRLLLAELGMELPSVEETAQIASDVLFHGITPKKRRR